MMSPEEMIEVIWAKAHGRCEIEFRRKSFKGDGWSPHFDCLTFNFADYDYRIKPEKKPDLVISSYVAIGTISERIFLSPDVSPCSNNVKFTFDGETRKLKSAEVI